MGREQGWELAIMEGWGIGRVPAATVRGLVQGSEPMARAVMPKLLKLSQLFR